MILKGFQQDLSNQGSNFISSSYTEVVLCFVQTWLFFNRLFTLLLDIFILMSPLFLFQLTPDYECVNFTLRQHLPVARMSPYIPLEIRDWYSPGMLIFL